ncbi:MAG: DUF2269 family protein [Actinobacteria bacterium]|nr:DUF2269 family protein [Actinomycetota bacterium]MBI3685848.1 DUF2269 family protein [Actinomycetota bacterium]
MRFLLLLHLITAIFIVGPLAMAAMTAGRYARSGEPTALRATARSVTIFGWSSLAVAVLGFGAIPGNDEASFSAIWVQASATLYLVAFAITMAMLVPALRRAATQAEAGEATAPLAGRLAALGGVISLLFVAITALMVYRP